MGIRFFGTLSVAALALWVCSIAPRTAMGAGEGIACGGRGGLTRLGCGAGMFCEKRPGECAGGYVAAQCESVPLGCPDLPMPVCGCDDTTYVNDCARRIARVSKAHDGACF